MTDLAVHVLEPSRRLDAIDRKILMAIAGGRLAFRRRDWRPGGTIIDTVLEANSAAGSRRVILRRVALVDQKQDRAWHLGFRVGGELRSLRALASDLRATPSARCRR